MKLACRLPTLTVVPSYSNVTGQKEAGNSCTITLSTNGMPRVRLGAWPSSVVVLGVLSGDHPSFFITPHGFFSALGEGINGISFHLNEIY